MIKKLNCILLIDDNEDDNYFHKIVLNELNITDQIEVVESGNAALNFLENASPFPELIFLDINMPKMNGWEFLEEYEKIKKSRDTPVIIIMLTTSLNPADKEKADSINIIDGFESKPLSEEILTRILQKFFNSYL